jgi:ribonuclease BN (tRNA processing enzyme)
MKYSLQVLSTHNLDSSPALLLKLDSARYIFNCPEGLQRNIQQNNIKIAKLRAILATRTKWSCIGGLPGLLLTFCDIPTSKPLNKFALVAPEGISRTIAAMRAFIFRKNIAIDIVQVSKYNHKSSYQDKPIDTVEVSKYNHKSSYQGLLDSFSICYKDENIVAYSTVLYSFKNDEKITPQEKQMEETINAHYIKTHKLMFPGICTKKLSDSTDKLIFPENSTKKLIDSG